MAVTLPQGEDLNEWIACNIADFYKQVNVILYQRKFANKL